MENRLLRMTFDGKSVFKKPFHEFSIETNKSIIVLYQKDILIIKI